MVQEQPIIVLELTRSANLTPFGARDQGDASRSELAGDARDGRPAPPRPRDRVGSAFSIVEAPNLRRERTKVALPAAHFSSDGCETNKLPPRAVRNRWSGLCRGFILATFLIEASCGSATLKSNDGGATGGKSGAGGNATGGGGNAGAAGTTGAGGTTAGTGGLSGSGGSGGSSGAAGTSPGTAGSAGAPASGGQGGATLALSPAAGVFGNVPTGSSKDVLFTLSNSGPAAASGIAATITGSSGFSLPAPTGNECGSTLAGNNATCSIRVRFTPPGLVGPVTGTLTVTTTTGSGPSPVSVSANAYGILAVPAAPGTEVAKLGVS